MLFRLLYPPKCVLCGQILEKNRKYWCPCCENETLSFPAPRRGLPFLEHWTSLWYYDGRVRESLLRFKFGGQRGYAEAYGALLARKIAAQFPEGFDLLTWVPTSRQRRRKRGFDQSERLATALGRHLGHKPVRTLRKTIHNPPQSGIHGYAQRRANVLGAYRAVDAAAIAGRRILLIDDIVTTGATAGECARVLLTAGAKSVSLAAVAAADKDRKGTSA
ncbi:MAG: ComF family protein [Firmicutes bacterium]|nr:ComF family protein [Bacillota bacterium]